MKIIWVKDQKEEWLRQEGRQSLPRAVPRGEEGLLCGVHSDGVWSLGLMPA